MAGVERGRQWRNHPAQPHDKSCLANPAFALRTYHTWSNLAFRFQLRRRGVPHAGAWRVRSFLDAIGERLGCYRRFGFAYTECTARRLSETDSMRRGNYHRIGARPVRRAGCACAGSPFLAAAAQQLVFRFAVICFQHGNPGPAVSSTSVSVVPWQFQWASALRVSEIQWQHVQRPNDPGIG